MTTFSGNGATTPVREAWEEEVLAGHRWGRLFQWFKIKDDRAAEEHARLKKLWESAQPLDESSKGVVEQILSLEICNWNLEESILALCNAIGAKERAKLRIGHWTSISKERWKKIWAYYLTLRNWLPCEGRSGHEVLLRMCDPDETIQTHVLNLLGDGNELKELYVERLCLCLEFMLGSPRKSAQARAHGAAVLAVEEEIRKHDPEGRILNALGFDSEAYSYYGLEPCHHKLFQHYDIIISSIGAGKSRAVMPRRGTGGFERATIMEKYLSPIESWIHGQGKEREGKEDKLFDKIHASLGELDNVKLFLASLLVSLLRSQQLAARKRAESRTNES